MGKEGRPGRINDRNWRGLWHYGKDLYLDGDSFFTPVAPYVMEQFNKTIVAGEWPLTATGGGTKFAASATAQGGAAIAATTGTTAASEELGHINVGWLVSAGPIVMSARLKSVGTTTAADGAFTVGLSNVNTATSAVFYTVAAGSTLTTSVPANFAGFTYASQATSGAAFATTGNNPVSLLTTNANTDTITRASDDLLAGATVATKDSLFHTYTIRIDQAGGARFYRDDQYCGYVAQAVATTAVLTPIVQAQAQNSHVNTVTVAYVYVAGPQV